MAYATCPGCRVPQMVRDDAHGYTCFSCASEVTLRACSHCGLGQTVLAAWPAFTCIRCERGTRVAAAEGVPAARVEGVGYPYPKV